MGAGWEVRVPETYLPYWSLVFQHLIAGIGPRLCVDGNFAFDEVQLRPTKNIPRMLPFQWRRSKDRDVGRKYELLILIGRRSKY